MGYNKCLFWPNISFSRLHHIHMKTVQAFWDLNTALSIYLKIQTYYHSYANIIPMPISFLCSKMNTFVKKSCIWNY